MMEKVGSEGFVRLIIAFICVYVLYSGGQIAYQNLQARTAMQITVNNSIERWKQSYLALQSVAKDWKTKYRAATSVRDIRSVIGLINLPAYGLEADTDHLYLMSAPEVKQNNMQIGLTKICLGTTGDGFIVKAPSYVALLEGIHQLARRDDIYIGSVGVEGNLPKPQAKIGDFCLYLRSE